jgi:hypothetical protein
MDLGDELPICEKNPRNNKDGNLTYAGTGLRMVYGIYW